MTLLRAALASGTVFVASMIVAFPALSSDGTEFACEEAVAHLKSCCPDLEPKTFDCHRGFSCAGEEGAETDLDLATSNCIQEMSCARIQAENLCALAQQTPEAVSCE